ncbi:DNA circularization N-terminal domain-containing protein [Gluconacetobacter entanii]|uniref:DNA circularization N-terminal domain-containing protein n=2 Tax=Gluconacetobacter entanii TaxID=108528 RepID=A0ABT3K113_9PROT|nr:DNA circularization N-terminal domain-containing protein [Gluconacetobacter entanii]MCW4589090.1 DNA circularization N-terminal domain-containing protein [Gluconacetobacter entanii]
MSIGTGILGSQLGLTGGLAASPLSSILSVASWRGVNFYMPNSREAAGRRVLQLYFPGRDDFRMQDFGQFDGPIQVRGILVGDDYVLRADRMRKALLAKGPATLIHPWWGALRCYLLQAGQIEFSEYEVRLARFEATFVRKPPASVSTGLFSGITDTLTNVLEQADALMDQCVLTMRGLLSPAVVPLALASAVNSTINVATGVWNAVTTSAPEPVQSATQTPLAALSAGIVAPADNADTTYADGVTDLLVNVPAAVAATVSTGTTAAIAPATQVADGSQTSVDPAQATALLLDGATQIGTQAQALSVKSLAPADVLVIALVARVGTVAQALATQSAVTYVSQSDAIAGRNAVTGALDDLADDLTNVIAAGADVALGDLSGAIRDARTAVVADISSRLGRLPKVIAVPVPRQISAWLIAYAVAGDTPSDVASVWDDLVSRNNLTHPALAGPGSVDVLETTT